MISINARRFATLLFSFAGLVALRLVFGGVGPSTFSVVIDAGSAGTRAAWRFCLFVLVAASGHFLVVQPLYDDFQFSFVPMIYTGFSKQPLFGVLR